MELCFLENEIMRISVNLGRFDFSEGKIKIVIISLSKFQIFFFNTKMSLYWLNYKYHGYNNCDISFKFTRI